MKFSFSFFPSATAAALVASLASGVVHAQEVTSLRGKPSSDMILEALVPSATSETAAAPAPARRRRGLSLGSEDMQEPEQAAQPAAPVPASASAPPAQTDAPAAQASAPVVQPIAMQQQPQVRALDLDIPFQFDSDQLTNDGKDVLDQLAGALKSDKLADARAVILEGHADATGSPGYNQKLSYKRAQSARNYLADRHSIPHSKLKAIGKGSSEPADPANPESEINRRVRIIVDL
jgi:outer membrane protein OmpA-like peptidoglycan-associated protein